MDGFFPDSFPKRSVRWRSRRSAAESRSVAQLSNPEAQRFNPEAQRFNPEAQRSYQWPRYLIGGPALKDTIGDKREFSA